MPSAAVERLRTLVETLHPGGADVTDAGLPARASALLDTTDASGIWLTLAVLRGELPDVDQVEQAVRTARFQSPLAFVQAELAELTRRASETLPRVRVIRDTVVVDVHNTVTTTHVSGIQRVVRETVHLWCAAHAPVLIRWTAGYRSPRVLDSAEEASLRLPENSGASPRGISETDVVIPWHTTYVLTELAAEPDRCNRLSALTRLGGSTLNLIGYDCIPLTCSETVSVGLASTFAQYMAAVRHASRVSAISAACAAEFRGWRRMVRAAGFQGPEVAAIDLPVEWDGPTESALAEARRMLCIPGMPLVLVVGTHEPRKNHLAVLHAAELLWREGHQFALTFVGAGSWRGESFYAKVAELQTANRPVQSIVALPDDLLRAAYELARFVVFPSLNEGFGLPITEAMCAGTPVIASNYGSMRDLVAPDGQDPIGLLVDPRDDREVADAMRTLLSDAGVYDRLVTGTKSRTRTTWSDYAAATWDFLVGTGAPQARPADR